MVDLAEKFGTPLWVIDEATITRAAQDCIDGLKAYPRSKVLYAGKAFLNLAMCHLIKKLTLGLDVVSGGELYTAQQAGFPAEQIYMHGNNKSPDEIESAIAGGVNIVVDNFPELDLVLETAARLKKRASLLIRVTPGVEPDTHHYIKTGQINSKFGFPLEQVPDVVEKALAHPDSCILQGLHAHIGSQSHDLGPYKEMVGIFADCYLEVKAQLGYDMPKLDVGGGLGIAYVKEDRPTGIHEWSSCLSESVMAAFKERSLPLPELHVEPGRSIIGTAGVTLYRVGYVKTLPGGKRYIAVDGGMADNPRPITYQAKYTARLANNMNAPAPSEPSTIVGRYCESGDIIVKESLLSAEPGDIIVIFATGAYNYSMASNYNRTGRPACVLVADGKADVILERESNADLMRMDRVPDRLL